MPKLSAAAKLRLEQEEEDRYERMQNYCSMIWGDDADYRIDVSPEYPSGYSGVIWKSQKYMLSSNQKTWEAVWDDLECQLADYAADCEKWVVFQL